MTARALLEADELLPCPFCGGKAKLSDYECGKAGMPMNYRNPRCTRCGVSFGYAKMDQAVSMWNRRAIASSLEGQAEDAARYRWLRNDPPVTLCVRERHDHYPRFEYRYIDFDSLDAAIDAARTAQAKDKPA